MLVALLIFLWLADLGVSRVVTMPPGTNPEVITQSLERFQQDVIAKM